MESPLFSRPAHLIHRASRLFLRLGDNQLQAFGVSIGQLPVLVALQDGKVLSQKELTALVKIKQPTMAQTLSRMERDGLIQRQPDPGDRRGSLISLCPADAGKMDAIVETLLQGNEEALTGFEETERTVLVSLLHRLIGNLEAMAARQEE